MTALSERVPDTQAVTEIPLRVQVEKYIGGRYSSPGRPDSWDQRKAGIDYIGTVDQRTIKLRSDGGQSAPQPGWVVMITGGNSTDGYCWTLYGLPREN